ncbi:hypothetical protein [Photobacterium kishitanii]|uniref:CSD domain-containing protein n=1 Tax=Photobacterium kishitanii TaxID=318456 RepID=A0A2T3KMC9_9GAMM|nr:hypothetical protein [Photobacterium kishitanii]PSV00905.1 hypothetical protein C9J27_02440 [Photobacterium kishitanii]
MLNGEVCKGTIVRVDPIRGFGFILIKNKTAKGKSIYFRTSDMNHDEFDVSSNLVGFVVKFKYLKTGSSVVAKNICYVAHPEAKDKKHQNRSCGLPSKSIGDTVVSTGAAKVARLLRTSSAHLKQFSSVVSGDALMSGTSRNQAEEINAFEGTVRL